MVSSIELVKDDIGIYQVIYREGKGMSCLGRSKSKNVAQRYVRKATKYLASGKLLPSGGFGGLKKY